jgi:hypothetical protein
LVGVGALVAEGLLLDEFGSLGVGVGSWEDEEPAGPGLPGTVSRGRWAGLVGKPEAEAEPAPEAELVDALRCAEPLV